MNFSNTFQHDSQSSDSRHNKAFGLCITHILSELKAMPWFLDLFLKSDKGPNARPLWIQPLTSKQQLTRFYAYKEYIHYLVGEDQIEHKIPKCHCEVSYLFNGKSLLQGLQVNVKIHIVDRWWQKGYSISSNVRKRSYVA